MDFTDDGPVWTDEERAQIAIEHDGMAERLFAQADRFEAADRIEEARRSWQMAWDAKDVADAARISSARLACVY